MRIQSIRFGQLYIQKRTDKPQLFTPSQHHTLQCGSSLPSEGFYHVAFHGKKHKYSVQNAPVIDKPFTTDMRELDLHCACCGHLMLKNKTVNDFLSRKVYFPAYQALDRIKHEQSFRLCEESINMQYAYSFIKRKAKENPELCMNELLSKKYIKEDIRKLKPLIRQSIYYLRDMCNKVSHPASYLVEELEALNPDFDTVEGTALKQLKRYAKIYPRETIQSILSKPDIKEYYLENLQSKQNTKLKKIHPLIQQLSPKYAKKAARALENSYKIFNTESTEIAHKRSRVLELFYNALNNIPADNTNDRIVADLILKRINELPDSKNDVNSLMLKGSQKNSNLFMCILAKRIVNTRDHVKPQHRKGDEGKNDPSNYLCLCGKCNEDRQTDSYDLITQKKPQMPEFTQIQIDEICEYINSGIFVEHDTWPNDIKTPLEEESNGKIIINTSKLDLAKAKENRKIILDKYIEQLKNPINDDFDAKGTVKRNPRK